MRMGDWIWNGGGNVEGLHLLNLFPWPPNLVCSQGMSDGVRGVIKGWDGGRKIREEDSCDPLLRISERKGRLQQAFCYQAWDEAGDIISTGEEREMWICHQPVDSSSRHLEEWNLCLCFYFQYLFSVFISNIIIQY